MRVFPRSGWTSEDRTLYYPGREARIVHGVTSRIRLLLAEDIPALLKVIDEAEGVLRDLEAGIEETPVTVSRVGTPLTPPVLLPKRNNRAPLSPLPGPARRYWDTSGLRAVWDPIRQHILAHIDRERTIIYPLALKILEGRMDHSRMLATPIAQMVAEHQEIRNRFPKLRKVALGYSPIAKHLLRIPTTFERHTRVEEIELFPALLELTDGNFDITATPLHTRYASSNTVSRTLRRARPNESKSTIARLLRKIQGL